MTEQGADKFHAPLPGRAMPVACGVSGSGRKAFRPEQLLSGAYRELDNDLARDNVENDMPDADRRDL